MKRLLIITIIQQHIKTTGKRNYKLFIFFIKPNAIENLTEFLLSI